MAAGGGTSSPRPRVVILSRKAQAPDAGIPAGLEAVCAGGAYEAAAELLAAPTAALVLDLAMLRERHLGLLRLARQTGAAVIAFGVTAAPIDAEQLAGVELVARADLSERLALLASAAPMEKRPLSRETQASASVETAAPARLVPAKQPTAPQEETKAPAETLVELALEEDEKQQEHGRDAHETHGQDARATHGRDGHAAFGGDARATPAHPGSLLSAEELSALLGEGDK